MVEMTNFAHSVAGASREATLIERFRRVSAADRAGEAHDATAVTRRASPEVAANGS